ncbi:hypothetical protein EHS13_27545 [Paenibacillus psychroresistens]|uniref:Uncharacterized protein n=1 Tax=Paenibacillus psychroresistens TaxID=1778678 RepID=A0A6B8RRN2_9BACL|nr:hypothetical protein [Paenibacillus psychroresistens]QGQ98372.1 hypothetical protein EHS13_27545 [Paenibacillus psychroresistens]
MMPVHQRMAELWTEQKTRKLTFKEIEEMEMCLEANANYARKLASLYNLSLMASMTKDWDWQHEICADIDRLELQFKL